MHQTEQRVSCTKIAEKMQSPLSNSTIRRNLRYMGHKYLLSTKSIILNDYPKKMRVQIVRSYITELIDFHKVVFTDEIGFTLDGNDNVKTWFKKNKGIVNRQPYKGESIMIWGAMTHTGAKKS